MGVQLRHVWVMSSHLCTGHGLLVTLHSFTLLFSNVRDIPGLSPGDNGPLF